MDAKQATMAVRDYFESIKKIKFFFEVINVELDLLYVTEMTQEKEIFE